ncbi:MAG: methylmalonyl Co-A mutase-associated GTPase MeaB [Bacteriovoracaceae bacterium]|nr:methylmalonyl Co-A mutase-associated GTPase MeaB [Bacteriovoracaceae bacterium]
MKNWTKEDFVNGFKNRDKNALSKAITLIESSKAEHKILAQELLNILKPSKPTKRIGISGTPGVGKSTFIESFGTLLTSKNLTVAVLAVDPTSQVSGGSILGDKTRMELLARDPKAFIRPSPSGGSLGGVAKRSREVIQLCEAFGFDIVLIETVGVGQSETAVANMVDCFMMLLQPGAGDDLQGIKRGILELVDLVVVTKADGEQLQTAEAATHHYQQALHILRQEGWHPPVLKCSALENRGLKEIWDTIEKFYQHLGPNINSKRSKQRLSWLDESIKEALQDWFSHQVTEASLEKYKNDVVSGTLTVTQARDQLMSLMKKGI